MMTNPIEFNIVPVAECSVLVTLSIKSKQQSSTQYAQYMAHFSDTIRQKFASVLMNVTPSYHTILVDYLPYCISENQFIEQLNVLLSQAVSSFSSTNKAINIIDLPAYYSTETTLDLARYQDKGLSLDDIIHYHTSQTYTVSAIGFIPGFAFMSDVVDELALPRQLTPRLSVPKGSIAIADLKTAVYPSESPGGWNIIGNCPLTLFDHSLLNNSDIAQCSLSLLNVGDSVRFSAISKQEFVALGGGIVND
ncbi:allophanate hydrolase subunit 1 [uncultured Vibrio sp.]|uniref:5-oxoprolinase subunit B family protein n=1 Tax=uncultured Vibrio sp. TaxID=114054 RepID=UPI00261D6A0A|nr:allophanate hydrolase subunit 1 [uncultured Vibrio sp.]